MSDERIVELLKAERECILRNESGCNRDCAECDLVQDSSELLEMYDYVIPIFEVFT